MFWKQANKQTTDQMFVVTTHIWKLKVIHTFCHLAAIFYLCKLVNHPVQRSDPVYKTAFENVKIFYFSLEILDNCNNENNIINC